MGWIAKFLMGLVIAYGAFCLALYLAQRSFIYFPDTNFPALPEKDDTGFVRVSTDDGLMLIGWYSPAQEGKKTIVYFHGNAGNIEHRLPLAQEYIAQGYGVLLAEYRGYGGNPGSPSEEGFYKDAAAYLDFLNQQDVPSDQIVLYGESIGSGVAVEMAKRYSGIAALLLVTPLSRALDLAEKHYSFVPVKYLLKDRFDNLSKIADLKMPVVFFMAGKDEVIAPEFGNTLYEAASAKKHRYDFSDAGHNTMPVGELNAKVIEVIRALP